MAVDKFFRWEVQTHDVAIKRISNFVGQPMRLTLLEYQAVGFGEDDLLLNTGDVIYRDDRQAGAVCFGQRQHRERIRLQHSKPLR